MVKVADIDTESYVKTFLDREVTRSSESEDDRGVETDAVLDSISLALLHDPQIAYTFILRAKNSIGQVANTCSDLLDAAIEAIDDLNNPIAFPEDLSDLIEAKTALLGLGSTFSDESTSLDRYKNSISRFLDNELAPLVKPRRREALERSGFEARQDLDSAIRTFVEMRDSLLDYLSLVSTSLTSFADLNLKRRVSTEVVSKILTSLDELQLRAEALTISNTSLALELLASTASLDSVYTTKSIELPILPNPGVPVTASPTQSAATTTSIESTDDRWTITSNSFDIDVDAAGVSSVDIPSTVAAGETYLPAFTGAPTYNVPVSNRLYVMVDGSSHAHGQPQVGVMAGLYPIDITSGASIAFSTIVSLIDTAGSAEFGCVELGEQGASSGTNRFLIYGKGATTKIYITKTAPYTSSGVAPPTSIHDVLFFSEAQESVDSDEVDLDTLQSVLGANVSTATFASNDLGSALVVTSNTVGPSSTLEFAAGLALDLFSSELVSTSSNSVEIVGDSLEEVTVGAVATVGINVPANITVVGSTSIILDTEVTTESDQTVQIVSKACLNAKRMVSGASSFSTVTNLEIQNKITPLLGGTASSAQKADALSLLQDTKTEFTDLLSLISSLSVSPSEDPFFGPANRILSALEERGMNRTADLLSKADFSTFGSLTSADSSYSSRMLTAIEEVGKNDLETVTAEDEWEDYNNLSAESEEVLPDIELPEEGDFVDGRGTGQIF